MPIINIRSAFPTTPTAAAWPPKRVNGSLACSSSALSVVRANWRLTAYGDVLYGGDGDDYSEAARAVLREARAWRDGH